MLAAASARLKEAIVLRRKRGAASKEKWLGWLLAFLILVVIAGQDTHNTGSDPRGTLLVSQAIVQKGTIQLDAYSGAYLDTLAHQIHRKNGHIYNYFPLGTALLSTPAVAVATALGMDMTRNEPIMQLLLTAAAALSIAFLLYRTARLYLPRTQSWFLAGLCWFGTSLASTVGTALWSHSYAFVFSSTAVFLVLRYRRSEVVLPSLLVGLSLFLAYLCRPTLALLTPFLLIWYFFQNRKSALLAASVTGLLLLGFMVWSMSEFGQILPDYYLPKRLEGDAPLTAIYGNLFSPARGLLVFSPFLALPLLANLLLAPRDRTLAALSLISLAWPAAHLLSISQFPHWWAGWSFGARLMVDALPGLFVGLFYILGKLQHRKRLIYPALVTGGLFAVYINTYQALFNPYAMQWNVEPNIDYNPHYLFDWRYPQFLHNKTRHQARWAEFKDQQLSPFTNLIDIPFDSNQVTFDGFYEPEDGFRWTEGLDAELSILLNERELKGEVSLQAGFLGNQTLQIALNGQPVYQGFISGGERAIRFSFPPEHLRAGLNIFSFHLPNAHAPQSNDPRILAMAFRKFSLR